MSFNLTELGNQLQEASEKTEGTGVSFAGKSLKLNTEEDAREVVEAIEKCKRLEYLDLEGNTLGPDAARAIATALEKYGANLKRALWKDMFTGRVKTEIPLALEYLGTGLRNAGTQLVELDLSDNAFGPIGVQGLAAFLSSSTCYTLKQLRLNNNGLGISGGKMLAKALLDCYSNSLRDGQGSRQLALKVFVAGRNRLENEGAEALAAVFRQLTSLEEVVMPQNGIYHVGIAALASGLSENPGLRILNLNDNTVGPKGAAALAKALPNFRFLESLNLGDCLLKTKGAVVLAESLAIKGSHPCLSELNLTFNEIGTRGADPIAQAMADKSQLTSLQLDGNVFGAKGRDVFRDALTASDRISALGTFEEDESESEGENEDGENESSENEDEESQDSENDQEKDEEETEKAEVKKTEKQKRITVEDFMKSSTGENLLLLQGDSLSGKVQSFIQQAKNLSKAENKYEGDKYTEELTRIIMKVSTLCGSGYGDVRVEAERLSDALYAELFSYAVENNQVSNLNNSLLINLGLMKREEKNVRKMDWNLEGCFKALEKVSQREYFLSGTRDTLKLFIEKPPRTSRVKVIDPCQEAKASLKAILDRLQTT